MRRVPRGLISLFRSLHDNHGPFSGGTFYGDVNAATGANSRVYGDRSFHTEASGNGSAAGANSGAFSGDNYKGANVSGTGNTAYVDNSVNTHQYWTHIDPNYVGYGLVFLTMIWMYAAWGEAWQDCNKIKGSLNKLRTQEDNLKSQLNSLQRQGEVTSTEKRYGDAIKSAQNEIEARKKELKNSLDALADEIKRWPSKFKEAIRFLERNNLEKLRETKLVELGFYQSPKITQHTISQRVKVFFSKNKEEILLFAVILFYCFYSTDKLAEQFRMRLSQLFACLCSLLQRQSSGNDNSHVSRSRRGNGSVSPGAPPTRVPYRDGGGSDAGSDGGSSVHTIARGIFPSNTPCVDAMPKTKLSERGLL